MDLIFFLNESPHNGLTPRLGKKIAQLAEIQILEKRFFDKNPIVTHIIVNIKSNLDNPTDFQSFDLKFLDFESPPNCLTCAHAKKLPAFAEIGNLKNFPKMFFLLL